MPGYEYEKLDDRKLVDLLLQEDAGAWDYLLLEVIAPLCRTRKYLEICSKNSISVDSLLSQVWMILHKNDYHRLRAFAFLSSLRTYLFIIVREAQREELREKIGKIPTALSVVDDEYPLMARNESDSAELKDEIRQANEGLAQLWRENAKQAWVLLMRNSLGLSSRDVAVFLDESISNVDQMNKRAKSKMKQFKEEKQ